MPKRNLVWIVIGAVIAFLLWKVPETFIRRDALLSQFNPLLDVHLQIRKNYVEPTDEKVLLHGAIDGMLNRLDPYSEYYDESEFKQFQRRTEGQFEGIGIEVGPATGGGISVSSPIEGSPAFYADVRADDRITEIDGIKTNDMVLAEAIRLIQGTPGTSVTLTILRPSTAQTFKKTIVRGLVIVRTVRGWARNANWDWDYMIDPQNRIGYIRISSFEGHTREQVDIALKQLLNNERMQALVVDVRDNPGGLLPVVVEIANRFIPEGIIVSTKGRNAPEQPLMASRENALPYFPMAILVNHGSASAAEILSGALRDHKRALVIGEQTFGKGSVQKLIKLDGEAGAVKLTTDYYYLPNGERIHGRGVTPNIVVNLTPAERSALIESQLAVYSTALTPTTTQATTTTTTTTTTAPAENRINIKIDRQLQEALTLLKHQLATQPSQN